MVPPRLRLGCCGCGTPFLISRPRRRMGKWTLTMVDENHRTGDRTLHKTSYGPLIRLQLRCEAATLLVPRVLH